jgi:hypothetical protein
MAPDSPGWGGPSPSLRAQVAPVLAGEKLGGTQEKERGRGLCSLAKDGPYAPVVSQLASSVPEVVRGACWGTPTSSEPMF